MGKPIAGQNQFPYTIGGFLVDGAKINGITYGKQLYIHKQRSYNMYDLMDTSGNIFQFIEIGHKNMYGEKLDYFTPGDQLAETIPDNTFFLKIQDPIRNIFSFVMIYQWHKCITCDGDYVFRTKDIDPYLSGVLISPSKTTIQVGSTVDMNAVYFPHDYQNQQGEWVINMFDEVRSDEPVKIDNITNNVASITGMFPGKAVLSYIPKNNSALIANSIVYVEDNLEDLESIAFKLENERTYFMNDQEIVINLVTSPYNYVFDEAPTFTLTYENGKELDYEYTVDVSSNYKKYTIKFAEQTENFTAWLHAKIEITKPHVFEDGMYFAVTNIPRYNFYQTPPIQYLFNPCMLTNSTQQAIVTIAFTDAPLVEPTSSNPSVATMNSEGLITTYDKTGFASFLVSYTAPGTTDVSQRSYSLYVSSAETMYDSIRVLPYENLSTQQVGSTGQYSIIGYKDGTTTDLTEQIKFVDNTTTARLINLKKDGSYGVTNINSGNIVSTFSTNMFTTNGFYTKTGDLYGNGVALLSETPGEIASTSLSIYTSNAMAGTQYLAANRGINIDLYASCNPYNATDFSKGGIVIEPFDTDVIELLNLDYVLEYKQFSLNRFMAKLVAKNPGEVSINMYLKDNPEIKSSIKIIVY